MYCKGKRNHYQKEYNNSVRLQTNTSRESAGTVTVIGQHDYVIIGGEEIQFVRETQQIEDKRSKVYPAWRRAQATSWSPSDNDQHQTGGIIERIN